MNSLQATGVAALLLEANPEATPNLISSTILSYAVSGLFYNGFPILILKPTC
jgi:hypothetical protein